MLAAERNGLLRASRPPCRLAVFRPAFCSSRRQRCAQLHAKRDKRAEEPPSIQEFLGTVLKDELKIEKERYRQSEELMDGPPKPWKVEDRPFTNVITLARTFKGEEILVEVDLDAQDPEEELDEDYDDDDESEPLPVRFAVTVAKEEGYLSFECQSNGQIVTINHMGLEDIVEEAEEDEEEEAPPLYKGPVFAELDQTLQQAFLDYLEERGVNGEFGMYLMELANDKLEVEYMNWLQRMEKFITR